MKNKLVQALLLVGAFTVGGFLFSFALKSSTVRAVAAGNNPDAHPLDPLTSQEIAATTQIIQQSGKAPEGSLYSVISLKEPDKSKVLSFKSGDPIQREAAVVVFDRKNSRTFEATVSLTANKITSWEEVKGVQPAISTEELTVVPDIVRADPRWQEAIKKRGITDFKNVMIDPWAPGTLANNESPNIRWIRALSYWRGTAENGYARPIEGIVVVVNMNTKKVERVIDSGVHPVPPNPSDLNEKAIGAQRTPPRTLSITQPEGPSFEVHGHEVTWQKWHFRFGVEPREGLILYQVGYEDKGKIRPIAYKISLAEMVVPYGETAKNWIFRNAFDEGEYGIGRLTDSLEKGTDALSYSRFFDAVFADDFGKPFVVPDAVALYERDGGLLWKHFEFYTNKNESRRARELVLTSVVTVGNYDYGFNWVFRQDGTLELQTVLTGIMLPKGVDVKSVAELKDPHEAHHWHLVAPNVACPHHQHFFNFRIDWDVDGRKNSVSELNVKSLPLGPQNEAANGFVMDVNTFKTEKEAQRELNMQTSRKWIVTSQEKDGLGYPTGYALIPGDNSWPYIRPQSKVRRRAGFIDHHMWVTAYDPNEVHAAGEYPNQGKPGVGLPQWTKANRNIENTDIVMWYTFGVTHTPRPEEWPVMPVYQTGFKLIPLAFFDRNPALDVPRSQAGGNAH